MIAGRRAGGCLRSARRELRRGRRRRSLCSAGLWARPRARRDNRGVKMHRRRLVFVLLALAVFGVSLGAGATIGYARAAARGEAVDLTGTAGAVGDGAPGAAGVPRASKPDRSPVPQTRLGRPRVRRRLRAGPPTAGWPLVAADSLGPPPGFVLRVPVLMYHRIAPADQVGRSLPGPRGSSGPLRGAAGGARGCRLALDHGRPARGRPGNRRRAAAADVRHHVRRRPARRLHGGAPDPASPRPRGDLLRDHGPDQRVELADRQRDPASRVAGHGDREPHDGPRPRQHARIPGSPSWSSAGLPLESQP